jgi:hypothetical protein
MLEDDNDYSNTFPRAGKVHIKYHSQPLSRKHCCCKESNKHSTVSVCVCSLTLVIWHGQRVRRIMSPVAPLVLQHFSTLPHKWHDLQKKKSYGTFFRAFPSVVRQMPGYNSQTMGTANTLPNLLCCFFVIRVVLLLIVMFYVLFMCKCVLPPGVNPTAVDKYIIINIKICVLIFSYTLLSEPFLILKRIKRSSIINAHSYSRDVPNILHVICPMFFA